MTTTFRKSLKTSERTLARLPLLSIARTFFPTAVRIRKTAKSIDQEGADYLVTLADGTVVGIDFKLRGFDPRIQGKDDLAVEIWSSVEHRITGYTAPKTDFIVWLYPKTGRAALVPFRPFRRRVAAKREIMIRALEQRIQATRGKAGNVFHSQHCYAPTWLFSDLLQESRFQPTCPFEKSA